MCARELSIDRRMGNFLFNVLDYGKTIFGTYSLLGFWYMLQTITLFLCHINRFKPLPIFNRTLKTNSIFIAWKRGWQKSLKVLWIRAIFIMMKKILNSALAKELVSKSITLAVAHQEQKVIDNWLIKIVLKIVKV